MTNDEALILLEAIQEAGYECSKWEQDFLASIEGWVEDGKRVTERQSQTLQSIYRKAVGG
jgi:hypothetical protein